ncbi:transcription regulatory protein, partial [Cystoisospora suis]
GRSSFLYSLSSSQDAKKNDANEEDKKKKKGEEGEQEGGKKDSREKAGEGGPGGGEEDSVRKKDEIASSSLSSYLQSKERYYRLTHANREEITELPTCLKGGKLRAYQMEGLNWMVSLYCSGLNGILSREELLIPEIMERMMWRNNS